MPRKKFRPAPDAARRRVICEHYSFNGGAPRCGALNHPWCLAEGEAPESCRFRKPPDRRSQNRTPPNRKKDAAEDPERHEDAE